MSLALVEHIQRVARALQEEVLDTACIKFKKVRFISRRYAEKHKFLKIEPLIHRIKISKLRLEPLNNKRI
jgi:hypothetical protein